MPATLPTLKDVKHAPNYTFIKADICDFEWMVAIFNKYRVDGVIHLAAESHVDRSGDIQMAFMREITSISVS